MEVNSVTLDVSYSYSAVYRKSEMDTADNIAISQPKEKIDQFIHSERTETVEFWKIQETNKNRLEHFSPLNYLESLRKDVFGQLNAFYSSLLFSDEDAELVNTSQEGIVSFLDENPHSIYELSEGRIPNYWNAENTAGRIWDVLFMNFNEESDREEFYNFAKNLLKQAYDEVQSMIGMDLPGLVTDTRERLFAGLEEFRDGTAPSEVSFK